MEENQSSPTSFSSIKSALLGWMSTTMIIIIMRASACHFIHVWASADLKPAPSQSLSIRIAINSAQIYWTCLKTVQQQPAARRRCHPRSSIVLRLPVSALNSHNSRLDMQAVVRLAAAAWLLLNWINLLYCALAALLLRRALNGSTSSHEKWLARAGEVASRRPRSAGTCVCLCCNSLWILSTRLSYLFFINIFQIS